MSALALLRMITWCFSPPPPSCGPLVKVRNDNLPRAGPLSDHLLPHRVPRPHALHDAVPVRVEVERTAPVLGSFAVKVYVGAVHVRRLLAVHDQADALLHQEENARAAAAFVRVFRAFPLAPGIQDLDN